VNKSHSQELTGFMMMLQCMSGDERCLDDRELEQSMKVLTSLQVDFCLLYMNDIFSFVDKVFFISKNWIWFWHFGLIHNEPCMDTGL